MANAKAKAGAPQANPITTSELQTLYSTYTRADFRQRLLARLLFPPAFPEFSRAYKVTYQVIDYGTAAAEDAVIFSAPSTANYLAWATGSEIGATEVTKTMDQSAKQTFKINPWVAERLTAGEQAILRMARDQQNYLMAKKADAHLFGLVTGFTYPAAQKTLLGDSTDHISRAGVPSTDAAMELIYDAIQWWALQASEADIIGPTAGGVVIAGSMAEISRPVCLMENVIFQVFEKWALEKKLGLAPLTTGILNGTGVGTSGGNTSDVRGSGTKIPFTGTLKGVTLMGLPTKYIPRRTAALNHPLYFTLPEFATWQSGKFYAQMLTPETNQAKAEHSLRQQGIYGAWTKNTRYGFRVDLETNQT